MISRNTLSEQLNRKLSSILGEIINVLWAKPVAPRPFQPKESFAGIASHRCKHTWTQSILSHQLWYFLVISGYNLSSDMALSHSFYWYTNAVCHGPRADGSLKMCCRGRVIEVIPDIFAWLRRACTFVWHLTLDTYFNVVIVNLDNLNANFGFISLRTSHCELLSLRPFKDLTHERAFRLTIFAGLTTIGKLSV